MTLKSKFCLSAASLVIFLIVSVTSSNSSQNLTAALPNLKSCGFVKATDRLYGSRSAEIGEYPWIAAIEYRNPDNGQLSGIKCVGSLINNKYVLTAAHCLTKTTIEPFRVWLGDWKLSTDPDCLTFPHVLCGNPVEKASIELQIPHENFHKGTGENDIALLRLKQPVEYTDFIQPVCLPNTEILKDRGLVAVSWGTTQEGKEADILQSVSLPHVPNEECEKVLKKKLPTTVICAGGEKGKDTCRGDGGAPLVRLAQIYDEEQQDHDLRWFQEGITSWGVGCGREGYPAVYTNVLKYMDWIIKNSSPKQ